MKKVRNLLLVINAAMFMVFLLLGASPCDESTQTDDYEKELTSSNDPQLDGLLDCGRLWRSSDNSGCPMYPAMVIKPNQLPDSENGCPDWRSPNPEAFEGDRCFPNLKEASFCEYKGTGEVVTFSEEEKVYCTDHNMVEEHVLGLYIFPVHDQMKISLENGSEIRLNIGFRVHNPPLGELCIITAIAGGSTWFDGNIDNAYFNISCDTNQQDGIIQEDYSCIITRRELIDGFNYSGGVAPMLTERKTEDMANRVPVCPEERKRLSIPNVLKSLGINPSNGQPAAPSGGAPQGGPTNTNPNSPVVVPPSSGAQPLVAPSGGNVQNPTYVAPASGNGGTPSSSCNGCLTTTGYCIADGSGDDHDTVSGQVTTGMGYVATMPACQWH